MAAAPPRRPAPSHLPVQARSGTRRAWPGLQASSAHTRRRLPVAASPAPAPQVRCLRGRSNAGGSWSARRRVAVGGEEGTAMHTSLRSQPLPGRVRARACRCGRSHGAHAQAEAGGGRIQSPRRGEGLAAPTARFRCLSPGSCQRRRRDRLAQRCQAPPVCASAAALPVRLTNPCCQHTGLRGQGAQHDGGQCGARHQKRQQGAAARPRTPTPAGAGRGQEPWGRFPRGRRGGAG